MNYRRSHSIRSGFRVAVDFVVYRDVGGPPLLWAIAIGGAGTFVGFVYSLTVAASASPDSLHTWASVLALAGALLLSEAIIGAIALGIPSFVYAVGLFALAYWVFHHITGGGFVNALGAGAVAFGLSWWLYAAARSLRSVPSPDADRPAPDVDGQSGTRRAEPRRRRLEVALFAIGLVSICAGFACDWRARQVDNLNANQRCSDVLSDLAGTRAPLKIELERVACAGTGIGPTPTEEAP